MLRHIVLKYFKKPKLYVSEHKSYLFLLYTKVLLARYTRRVESMSTCDV